MISMSEEVRAMVGQPPKQTHTKLTVDEFLKLLKAGLKLEEIIFLIRNKII